MLLRDASFERKLSTSRVLTRARVLLVHALLGITAAGFAPGCFDPQMVPAPGGGGRGGGASSAMGGSGGQLVSGGDAGDSGSGGDVGSVPDPNSGAAGDAGGAGAAGMTGAGGVSGSGGIGAAGGVTGAGGAVGSGGTVGSGGASGSAGSGGTPAPGTGGASAGGTGGCAGTATGNRCGVCGPVCSGTTSFCDTSGPTPACTADPAAPLNGLRWEVPCGAQDPTHPEICAALPAGKTECPEMPTRGHYPVDKRVTFGGRPGVLYDVTIRFQGVVEPKIYTGGTASADGFRVGGTATATNYNPYTLSFAGPTRPELNQVYHLNDAGAEMETRVVKPIDYMKKLRVEGGSTVRLLSYDPDCKIVRNCRMPEATNCMPYQVAGSAYPGQFVQMNLISTTLVPPGG